MSYIIHIHIHLFHIPLIL